MEGSSYLFQCAEIRQNNKLAEPSSFTTDCPCLIKIIMQQAEDEMRNFLRSKTLLWLQTEVYKDMSMNRKDSIEKWLNGIVFK